MITAEQLDAWRKELKSIQRDVEDLSNESVCDIEGACDAISGDVTALDQRLHQAWLDLLAEERSKGS